MPTLGLKYITMTYFGPFGAPGYGTQKKESDAVPFLDALAEDILSDQQKNCTNRRMFDVEDRNP